MTQAAIQDQIKAIQQATKQAIKSKQAALQFLINAGIVSPQTDDRQAVKSSKKK